MKPQKRPFVVELKRPKRATAKAAPSIWATVDLKGIAADVAADDETAARIEEPAAAAIAGKQPRILPALPEAPPTPKLAPVTESAPAAAASDMPVEATETRKLRRRRRGLDDLPRGERWKRRLPKILRRR